MHVRHVAIFDVVDLEILVNKLQLYGFTEDVTKWFSNYLTDRKQCVCINGDLSKLLDVKSGVPQGSILGPLLYTIFTNELPEVVLKNGGESDSAKLERKSLCCYADDSTLTCIGSDHTNLTQDLSENYKTIADFLANNRLMLNEDKTKLLVMTSSNRRSISQAANLEQINLSSGDSITQVKSHKLLGCQIQSDLKWTQHIRDNNEDNMIKGLNQRINALKKIRHICNFKTRKMIANGIFLSKLSYMITVWSSCSKDLMSSLQVLQNRAAKLITKNDWSVSTETSLREPGWLSVYKLSQYHTILQIHKVKQSRTPEYMYSMYN